MGHSVDWTQADTTYRTSDRRPTYLLLDSGEMERKKCALLIRLSTAWTKWQNLSPTMCRTITNICYQQHEQCNRTFHQRCSIPTYSAINSVSKVTEPFTKDIPYQHSAIKLHPNVCERERESGSTQNQPPESSAPSDHHNLVQYSNQEPEHTGKTP